MTVAIKVENLSKKYLIKHENKSARYETLSETLIQGSKNFARKIIHPFSGKEIDLETKEEFWALKDVDFEINQGDKVGIIGRNGAGKSTLLKILSRITEPTSGKVHINGRIASLLEVGTGFHPELSGRENIYLNGAILGMSRKEIKTKFDEIVDFAEVEKFLDTPVKRYSSGMYVRLAFSVAAHLEPEILLVDEVLAVGDAEFQKKCLAKMEVAGNQGCTIFFVSHNISAIKILCSKAILLQNGMIFFEGDVNIAAAKYTMRNDDQNSSFIQWSSTNAPSLPSKSAQLREVGLLNDGKQIGAEVLTELPIQVYIRFVVSKDVQVGTSVLLYDSEGILILPSISNHEPEWHKKVRPRGVYESICEIPANLLADGRYSVSISFWEGHYKAGIVEKEILQFTAHEKGYVRGDYSYEMKGVIHPLFQWKSRMIQRN